MSSYRFKDYAHESPENEEQMEFLVEDEGWPEEVAEKYIASHNPMYEVEVSFEYDSDTDELRVLEAVVDGTILRPVDDSA